MCGVNTQSRAWLKAEAVSIPQVGRPVGLSSSGSSSESSFTLHATDDPEDEPLRRDSSPVSDTPSSPIRVFRRGLTQVVIDEELHTEPATTMAVIRVRMPHDEHPHGGPQYRTGQVQAMETEDWVYGVNRPEFPYRTGLNFSFEALKHGTGADEAAMPTVLRHKYLKETEGAVRARRDKIRAGKQDAPTVRPQGRGRGRGRFSGGRGRGRASGPGRAE